MFVIFIQVKMKFRFDFLKSDYGINIDDIQSFEFQCTFTVILTHSILIKIGLFRVHVVMLSDSLQPFLLTCFTLNYFNKKSIQIKN